MAKLPVRKMNDGTTNYFPVSVLDSVFVNKEISIKNTIGGLAKGSVIPVNTSLYSILTRIFVDEGLDITTALSNKVDVIAGKGLSTNDFDDAYKTVIDNLPTTLAGKVNVVTGKDLSSNDFTDAYKTQLDGLDEELEKKVDSVSGKGLSSNDFTDDYKEQLDNLDETLEGKVSTEEGKGLSSNNFTTEYKTKLDNLDTNLSTKLGNTASDFMALLNGMNDEEKETFKIYLKTLLDLL